MWGITSSCSWTHNIGIKKLTCSFLLFLTAAAAAFQEQAAVHQHSPMPEILFWASVAAVFKHHSKWCPKTKKWFEASLRYYTAEGLRLLVLWWELSNIIQWLYACISLFFLQEFGDQCFSCRFIFTANKIGSSHLIVLLFLHPLPVKQSMFPGSQLCLQDEYLILNIWGVRFENSYCSKHVMEIS